MSIEASAPVTMVCETCGSDDVVRDAWAEWDVGSQEWVLRTVFDQAVCETCDGETHIVERPVSPQGPEPRERLEP